MSLSGSMARTLLSSASVSVSTVTTCGTWAGLMAERGTDPSSLDDRWRLMTALAIPT
ncbi:hypothetical protein [Ensifer aridi]|uniref:hypothetical protein n=1 Tax=Ensifer aridi TaxID=1708715 RepID=UPI001FCDC46F|nr:hypothetical protein [Ensifer aridi]